MELGSITLLREWRPLLQWLLTAKINISSVSQKYWGFVMLQRHSEHLTNYIPTYIHRYIGIYVHTYLYIHTWYFSKTFKSIESIKTLRHTNAASCGILSGFYFSLSTRNPYIFFNYIYYFSERKENNNKTTKGEKPNGKGIKVLIFSKKLFNYHSNSVSNSQGYLCFGGLQCKRFDCCCIWGLASPN